MGGKGNKLKRAAGDELDPETGKPLPATLSSDTGLPRKRFYRARAHSNPLNDCQFEVPRCPQDNEWSALYPAFFAPKAGAKEGWVSKDPTAKVRFADVGCGFGGLLINLSKMFPDTLSIGMELRDKVSEYVKERILALRRNHPGEYENIACLRANSMKYMPNYFEKGQLQKLFFLFPDPHFKVSKHRRRIVTVNLLAEYAYIMQEGGILYTVTDVPELGEWMSNAMEKHPLFQRIPEEEYKKDPVTTLLVESSEEGQKVARNEGLVCINIFRRIAEPPGLNLA